MQKGKLKNILAIVLMVVMALSIFNGCSTNNNNANDKKDSKTITIGYVNWAECVATSNLWKNIFEEQGYTVKLKQLDVAPLFVGLNEGDVDLFFDCWLPITHGTYWEKYKDNIVDCGTWYKSAAKIGVVVPSYVTIDSIDELNKSADKFNNKIIGVDPGAGIMKASKNAVKDYGLKLEVVQGSEAAMLASLKKAYEKKEWIAVTGWSPHWMFSDYDLKYLKDPKGTYGKEEEIHLFASSKFAKENEKLISMLKNFKMDDNQLGSLEKLINDGMSPEKAAEKWNKDNKTTVEKWTSSKK